MTPKSWTRQLFRRPITSPIRRKAPRTRLDLLKLEDRWVPATFTVLNSNDTGLGSLRDAVAQANANLGIDTIVFGDGSGTGGTNFTDLTPDLITLSSGRGERYADRDQGGKDDGDASRGEGCSHGYVLSL